jgi:hypothetical protein
MRADGKRAINLSYSIPVALFHARFPSLLLTPRRSPTLTFLIVAAAAAVALWVPCSAAQ